MKTMSKFIEEKNKKSLDVYNKKYDDLQPAVDLDFETIIEFLKNTSVKNPFMRDELGKEVVFKILNSLYVYDNKNIEHIKRFLLIIYTSSKIYSEDRDILVEFHTFMKDIKNQKSYRYPFRWFIDVLYSKGISRFGFGPGLIQKYLKYEQEHLLGLLDISGLKIWRDTLNDGKRVNSLLGNDVKKFRLLKYKYGPQKEEDAIPALDHITKSFKLFITDHLGIKLTQQEFETYVESKENTIPYDRLEILKNKIYTNDSTDFDKFIEVIPTSKKEYTKQVLVSLILGIIENCYGDKKYDRVLIVKSPQGYGKSVFFNDFLFKSFADFNLIGQLPKSNKYSDLELQMALTENVIILDEEFSNLQNAEVEQTKKITSERSIKILKKYAKDFITKRSIATLIGSTNNETFLKDTTGNRRYNIIEFDRKLQLRDPIGGDESYQLEDLTKLGVDDINWDNVLGYIFYLYFEKGARSNHKDFKPNEEIRSEIAEQHSIVSDGSEYILKYVVRAQDTERNYLTKTEIMDEIQKICGKEIRIGRVEFENVLSNKLNIKGKNHSGKVVYNCYIMKEQDKPKIDFARMKAEKIIMDRKNER